MDYDATVYFANTLKDDDEGGIGVAERPFIDPMPVVRVIIRKQSRGKRAQVIEPRLAKPFDDRPPEVLGFCHVQHPDPRAKARGLRVVLPKDGAHFPVTKERELARIAEFGEEDSTLWQFVNRPPVIGPDGSIVNPFGNAYLVDSVKNFVFFNDNDELVFMLYKAAEGTFTVKGSTPFTPLAAFALAVAIVSG